MNLNTYAVLGIILFILYIITAFKIIEGLPAWLQHFSFFALNALAFMKVMLEKKNEQTP